uniref:Uncharacterized protein n=1 Tax=Percolomonas cosmopolitus TaxID=63605 RepID=A0A7S1KRR1_9EUKA|mmetsp:Transcript_6327/g.23848  ORF Transcript_6327/g.23848 Transcript_6327/m.23848 type:complete len:122 (+) Transcript_6327:193-558(+)
MTKRKRNPGHQFKLNFKKCVQQDMEVLDKHWQKEQGFFSDANRRVKLLGPGPDGKGEIVPGINLKGMKSAEPVLAELSYSCKLVRHRLGHRLCAGLYPSVSTHTKTCHCFGSWNGNIPNHL